MPWRLDFNKKYHERNFTKIEDDDFGGEMMAGTVRQPLGR